jgi:hypothetical protein
MKAKENQLRVVDKQSFPDLSLTERKWLKEYLDKGDATEAALAIYKTKNRNVAYRIGIRNLYKIPYDLLLEQAGVTDQDLARNLKDGLKATKKYETPEHKIQDIPDYFARHKYLETSYKLKHKLTDKITIGGDSQEALKITLAPAPIQAQDAHQTYEQMKVKEQELKELQQERAEGAKAVSMRALPKRSEYLQPPQENSQPEP